MRRVNLEVDRLSVNALVVACYPGCFRLYFTLYLGEIVKPSSRVVKKLAPFLLTRDTGGRVGDMNFIMGRFVLAVARKID